MVKRIAGSAFCLGSSQSGWRADFDWFLKPSTHLRVMEGRYDDREGKTNRRPTAAEEKSAANMELLAKVRKGEL